MARVGIGGAFIRFGAGPMLTMAWLNEREAVSGLGAKIPGGKWLRIEVGDSLL